MNAIIIDNEIQITFQYDPSVVERVRTIEGRKWDSNAKVWKIPATAWHAKQVLDTLPEFYLDPTIKFMADGEVERISVKLPKELYKFQKEGVKYIASVAGRCIIADDMGLGKSAEALVYSSLFTEGRILIIAPASVTFKWRDVECPIWAKGKSVEIIRSGKDAIPNTDIVILSYALMVSKFKELSELEWGTLILDEAHYVKGYKTQRTRIARALIQTGIPHILMLSGTPFMNHPGELFSLLNMLDNRSFSNYFSYATRYCGAFKSSGMWVFPRDVVTNREELQSRLQKYMIRRTKQEVELQLPELYRSFVPVQLSSTSEYKKELLAIKRDTSNPLVALSKLRQIIGKDKVAPTVELVENILQSGRKVVVFAHHKEVVSALQIALRDYTVGTISGDTPAEERQKQADKFLLDNDAIRVMIITVAGAEGINLYSASDIIFCEREYTPAKEEQAEARLHRIGQKNAVTAWYVVVGGTVDEKMNEIVKRKRSVIGQVISQNVILEEIMKEIL